VYAIIRDGFDTVLRAIDRLLAMKVMAHLVCLRNKMNVPFFFYSTKKNDALKKNDAFLCFFFDNAVGL